ncbi:sensor histidine kinase [Permianibacter sp. IMCC34836]|uniref:sensor histidine kinase n=1 Tax=Permianibacter fluminis TaxID=2738515 RepID=UPI001551D661|nr:sensor histidine kinase [Permianibacter fluminis]NQD36117.1 sensor histidine kinase [Permianibacter fluminis]
MKLTLTPIEPSASGANNPEPARAAFARWWREQALAPSADFLPDFCDVRLVFLVVLGAELMALVLALAQSPRSDLWQTLGLLSLFVQWVALTCTAALCRLRRFLAKRSLVVAAGLSYLLILAMTALFSLLAVRAGLGLDRLTAFQPELVVARNLAIAGIIGAVALRYFYLQQQYRRRLKLEAEARVQALQARIHPHFLFNSMNTIASLTRSNPRLAETMVENLSELFRASLALAGSKVTLAEEFDLCQRYLDIEQLRLGSRLKVSVQLADELRTLPVPLLLVQPLVENAVYHGVQPLPEGGWVRLQASVVGNSAEIVVSNPVPNQPSRAGHGVALANIRERLAVLYPAGASLSTHNDNQEFVARVIIPYQPGHIGR